MNWKRTIRQFHRSICIVFTLIVLAIFGLQLAGVEPAEWVYLTPLPFLFLLMLSGLYLFALPYLRSGRTGSGAG